MYISKYLILTNTEIDFKICQICQNFLFEKLNYSKSTIQHHFEYDYELQFLKIDYYTGVVKAQSAKIWPNFHLGGGGYCWVVKL